MSPSDDRTAAVGTTRSGPDVVVRVPTQESELRAIRQQVRSFAEAHGADDDTIADFELVVSELATNVIQHSDAESVTVGLRRTSTDWSIDVHDADDIPELESLVAPDTGVAAGRGLLIVQAVMDHVEVIEIGGYTLIRCTKSVA